MANVKLPWQLAFQATGRYSSDHKEAQGSHQGGWSVDLGLRKTFGDWSVSLNCRDLFDSRKWKNTTIGDNYEQYNERWRGGRQKRNATATARLNLWTHPATENRRCDVHRKVKGNYNK